MKKCKFKAGDKTQRHAVESPTFTKHDSGKPRLSIMSALVPPYAMAYVERVLKYGADKYGADNWIQCTDWERYYYAALRHLKAYRDGELTDPDSSLPHLAHAICSLMFLSEGEYPFSHPQPSKKENQ